MVGARRLASRRAGLPDAKSGESAIPANHTPMKLASLTVPPRRDPVISCMRGRRVELDYTTGIEMVRDRARSLPVDRVQLRKLVEHLGIAPSIPVWKVPCGRPSACISQHLCSRYETGVPCGSCTCLNGFADRCLGCSANGTMIEIWICLRRALACSRREILKDFPCEGARMKFALLADIHANLEALQAVLRHAAQQNCTNYAFLGDIVGYCADPKHASTSCEE
jgi:hypothetical protein